MPPSRPSQFKSKTDRYLVCVALVLAGERLCVALLDTMSPLNSMLMQAGLLDEWDSGTAPSCNSHL